MSVRLPSLKHQAANDNFGWTSLCQLDDLLPLIGARALLGERQIALFRIPDDTVYAIGAYDPFSDAAVLSRGIVGDIKGEPVVASPVYKHHFSLKTGRCIEQPSLRVPVYRVRMRDGEVQVLQAPV